MRRSRYLAVALTVVSLVVGVVPASAADLAPYIVVLRDDAGSSVDDVVRGHAVLTSHRYDSALHGFAARLTASQRELLLRDARVEFVAIDIAVAAAAEPVAPGERVPTGIRRIGAASTETSTAARVAVAVLDTGVDLVHPDLNAVDGKSCVKGAKTAQDDHGHGTHVAGIIAARNQGAGVIGVVPGTRIVAVKVLDARGGGSLSDLICGIDWVTRNASRLGIRVANLSLAASGGSDARCGRDNQDPLHRAICGSVSAGVTYVVAAGNAATDLAFTVPAAYSEVLPVTAMADSDGEPGSVGPVPSCRSGEADDTVASFSNFAVAAIDAGRILAAPGVCIESTWLGGGYGVLSGTSQATPHVTGVVALCFGTSAPGPCTGMQPSSVTAYLREQALERNTEDVTYGFDGDPLRAHAGRSYGYLTFAAVR
jgi:subtilisin